MSDYIGREPYTSSYYTDTFTGNGGSTYNLTYLPGASQSLLVFIDGIYQMPGISNAFTVNNQVMTFTENISSLSTIFVVYLGLAGAIGAPGVGTVDFAQLSANVLPAGAIWDYGGIAAPTGWLLCDGSIYARTSLVNLYNAIGTRYGNGTGTGLDFTIPDFRSRMSIGAGSGLFNSSFLPAAVNAGTSTISVTANNSLFTGTPVGYSSTGTTVGGLTNPSNYFIIRITNTQVRLATTLANAQNGVNIALSSTGTGVHSLIYSLTTRTAGDVGGEESHAMSATELLSHTHQERGTGTGGPANFAGMQAATNLFGSSQTQTFDFTAATGGNQAMNTMNPFLAVTKIIKT